MPLDPETVQPTTPYERLLLTYAPRPITNESRYSTALRQIDSLMRKQKRSRAEEDMLDVLTALVAQFEHQKYPAPNVPPGEILQHLMEVRGATKAEVARQTGIARQTITNIVTGARGVSQANRAKLAAYFHVSPAVFLPEK